VDLRKKEKLEEKRKPDKPGETRKKERKKEENHSPRAHKIQEAGCRNHIEGGG